MPRPPDPIHIVIPADGLSAAQLRQAILQSSKAINIPDHGVQTTAAAEAANVRAVTLQVVDLKREPVKAVVPVIVWLSTTDGGPPSGAQTVAVATGTTLATYLANQCYLIMSDASGKIVLNVTVTGSATRYVMAAVCGFPSNPPGFAWAP
jgi:hypothetical protein